MEISTTFVDKYVKLIAVSNEKLTPGNAKDKLGKGLFYPRMYYDKLKQAGFNKRLEFLKTKNCFGQGLLPIVPSNVLSLAELVTRQSKALYRQSP